MTPKRKRTKKTSATHNYNVTQNFNAVLKKKISKKHFFSDDKFFFVNQWRSNIEERLKRQNNVFKKMSLKIKKKKK